MQQQSAFWAGICVSLLVVIGHGACVAADSPTPVVVQANSNGVCGVFDRMEACAYVDRLLREEFTIPLDHPIEIVMDEEGEAADARAKWLAILIQAAGYRNVASAAK